jgi:hypothetical protein
MDLFFSHFPISSLLDPSRRRKSVLHVRVAGLPILRWSRSSKNFLPHSFSSLKLPLFDASVPSFDSCSQRWLWRYHTRSVQCFAADVLTSCSLAHPACFRKALRSLFVHTERTVVSPFRTLNVIRSVRSSHLLLSSEISRPFSARVSACSLIGSPRCDFTFIRKVALPDRTRCVSRHTISRRRSASVAVANVAFPPCPTHFLITHKTASLSHNRRASSLRTADCNSSTIPPATLATPWRRGLGPCRRTRRRRALVGCSHDWKGMKCVIVTRLLIWDRTGPFVLDCDRTGPFVLDRD